MAFIDDIAARLVSQGVGVIGTNIFKSSKAAIPTGAGPYLVLTETGGSGSTRIQNQSGAATRRPTAQIAVRAVSYPAALAMAEAAWLALDGLWNSTLNGNKYKSVTARQEPTDIGLDASARPMIVFNVDGEKKG